MTALLTTYAGLLALLALTVGLSFAPLGIYSILVNVGIAAAKAALIMVVFMQLRQAQATTRLMALAGFIWLGILFCLIFTDYLFR